jgi:hypothetical protein
MARFEVITPVTLTDADIQSIIDEGLDPNVAYDRNLAALIKGARNPKCHPPRRVHAWDWLSAIDRTVCLKPRRNRSMEAWVRRQVTCPDCLSKISAAWPGDVLPRLAANAKRTKGA